MSGTASVFATSGQRLARVSLSSGIRVDRALSRIVLSGMVKGNGAREDPLPPRTSVWGCGHGPPPGTLKHQPWAPAPATAPPPLPCTESLERRWETMARNGLNPILMLPNSGIKYVFIIETFSTSGYFVNDPILFLRILACSSLFLSFAPPLLNCKSCFLTFD